MPDEDRQRLRHTFNQAAGATTTSALITRLSSSTSSSPSPGWLRATTWWKWLRARQGHHPAGPARFPDYLHRTRPELAAAARRNLAPGRRGHRGRFEEWQPRPDERFDLVYAATAWHWIDPAVRYRRAWQLLRPGGHLAFWSACTCFPTG